MTCHAFEGGAGCGKTHRLIECLRGTLEAQPLRDGQRVLATTFMHGSRRRLDGRLHDVKQLSRKYECSTLDSYAWRWVSRWRTLCTRIAGAMPHQQEFDAVCGLAARLLEYESARAWVAATFPILLVDEAQDLTVERLAVVKALAKQTTLIVAADEFQCLQQSLRPNPFAQWSAAALQPERLSKIWRTNVTELLEGAAALRSGRTLSSSQNLKIVPTASAALAGSWLANCIGWYGRGRSVAIVAPTISPFVADAVNWVQQNTTSKGNGPFNIAWERGEQDELAEMLERLNMAPQASIRAAIEAVEALEAPATMAFVRDWIETQQNVRGREQISRTEIEAAIERAFASRRRFGRGRGSRLAAMTIHSAKNREFDGVVVLWPYEVGGDNEQKRRLLYNAITRARLWALILVQGGAVRATAPFA